MILRSKYKANDTEESELLDHKTIGRAMDLYHFDDYAPGMVYWHYNGLILRSLIENIITQQNQSDNYREVKTPILAKEHLWDQSGHINKYKENMFVTKTNTGTYLIKPMSCPLHAQIFNSYYPSYRSLPFKISEFGLVHRYETSGSLNGLFRARSFTQDDAHIFCTAEQIKAEVVKLIQRICDLYNSFGFDNLKLVLAGEPTNALGDRDLWLEAETRLEEALLSTNKQFIRNNDGAFYGPKIEFSLQDNMGRWWQCGTIQLDFFLSKKLNCRYVSASGDDEYPIVIHRAIIGSIERFIGILLEHSQGKLPLWLHPVQIVLCSLSPDQIDYSQQIYQELTASKIRCQLDIERTSISERIHYYKKMFVPIIGIIGSQEQQQNNISLRIQNKIVSLTIQELIRFINNS